MPTDTTLARHRLLAWFTRGGADGRVHSALAAQPMAMLLGGVVLTMAPHLWRIDPLIACLAVLLTAWRGWTTWRHKALPNHALVVLLACFATASVYLRGGTLLGRDAGVSVLVVFVAIKLLETRTLRDTGVVACLCFFLAITAFFYDQSPLTAAQALVATCTVLAAMIGLNSIVPSWRTDLKRALALMAQALPVMLILFVLFPRLGGPLWSLPDSARAGMTGLSDSMSPGMISDLSQSDAIALRAQFDGPIPPRAARYWRGPILDQFDGQTWSRTRTFPFRPEMAVLRGRGELTRYEVTLEPNNQPWLFALDIPGQIPPEANYMQDYQLLARDRVVQRLRYRVSSYLDYEALWPGGKSARVRALSLPEGSNPRSVALATEWRADSATDAEYVQRAVRFMEQQRLVYTLSPPLALGPHTVDEFLFDSKEGFCEHFAAAFTVLMRAGGIPARVVTGYQGGEINSVDGYMEVRQSDAHAWTEIFLPDRGWLRMDPTAIAHPARIGDGMARALRRGDGLPLLMREQFSWLNRLREHWDALSNAWNQSVLGYDQAQQRNLLERLGIGALDSVLRTVWITAGVALALAAASLLLIRERTADAPAQQEWNRFCRRLARQGVVRRAAEGPRDFTERACAALPDHSALIAAIGAAFIELQYGPQPTDTPMQVTHLHRQISALPF